MTIKAVDIRFKKIGPYNQAQLIRDLITTVEDLNRQLTDAQAQITVLKDRLDSAGIP